LSQPPGSLHGKIKITEQGEVIAYRYSNRDIAHRHLQQVVNAVLLMVGAPPEQTIKPEWLGVMEELAVLGRHAWRDFVYETEGFGQYWIQATPIHELAQLPIGSRPAKRAKGGFENVRAIPWVFSWMQSRAIIPSWFGLGYALQNYRTQNGESLALLREMYDTWSFFRALIQNAQLDLAKADMGIVERYASLVQDGELRREILGRIQTEHALASIMICEITGQRFLLEHAPVLRLSIERRNPYTDPLNFIQVALLAKYRTMRETDKEYEATLAAILATVNGIAAAMKTTG
jgi:phosphoenolpyruvate carboxylase